MALLYSNENFPRAVVTELENLGHNVLTTLQAGQANQSIPDDAVLAFATTQGRAVITLNRKDFLKLHRENNAHAGIIVCFVDPDPINQAQIIHGAISGHASLNGKIFRVNKLSFRVE